MARTAEQEGASPVAEYARLPAEAVAAAEGVDPQQGLSDEEAARRLQRYGPNTVEGREVTPWRLVRRQLESALTLLLIAAAVLALFLGDLADGVLILGLVSLNAALGFFQEYRATRALQELRRLLRVEARVRRGGSVRCIPASDVVPGDIVLVQAGDIVPADLRLTEAEALAANEAPLTGEALPVPKVSAPQPGVTGRPTRIENTLFTGTTVVAGRGEGIAVATGSRTYFGQTAALLRGLERPGPWLSASEPWWSSSPPIPCSAAACSTLSSSAWRSS
jgi:magnesium-transporting ATPase (P-type)